MKPFVLFIRGRTKQQWKEKLATNIADILYENHGFKVQVFSIEQYMKSYSYEYDEKADFIIVTDKQKYPHFEIREDKISGKMDYTTFKKNYQEDEQLDLYSSLVANRLIKRKEDLDNE